MSAVDQPIRDRAITETGHSFALSAGAGSGKTSVLTARVLRLLESGVEPARIAAITFTEKAAGELQERVRDGLEKRLATASSPVLEQALDKLAQLQLSTIHSFCQRLLTLEALEAGWAPDTEVLPAVVQSEGVAAAYTRWRQGFARRHPEAAFLVRCLVKPGTLRGGALTLVSYRDLEPVADPLAFDPVTAHPGFLEVHQRLMEARALCTAPNDNLLVNNTRLLGLLDAASALEPGDAVVQVLASSELGGKGGRKGNWVGDGKETFLEARQAFLDWRAGQLARLHGVLVRDLYEHFLPAAEQAKADHGVADFDDLLFRAAELLAHDGVRARLAQRYQALLVDEVQDTDPIQAEVAALLARAPTASGPWDAHAPEPGRIFAVGDPRQSIYRFRRADVATWDALRTMIEASGESLTLVQNFRSVPGIVDWVNTTFAELPGYVPQQAYRGAAELQPVVTLPCDVDDELETVARYLLQVHSEGRVVDRGSGQLRPVGWSDIMLLLPAWSAAERLQAVLTRAGIPCLVEGGGAFFERDEIKLAMAALQALQDPADEQSTVLVLRGLFGIDWPTLVRHKANDGSWRYTVPNQPEGPVADAFELLKELSWLRGRRPWVDLLDELLGRTRAAATWAALRGGEARLANLDKLRALLRQVESNSRSPGDALRALQDLDKDKDLSRSDLDSDAVRITSYFKAKGLEAPVVVLAHPQRSADGVIAAVDRTARKVALRINPLEPRDWEHRKLADAQAADAERARWMYVAATRARDQLVIVDRDKANLLAHLAAGLGDATPVDVRSLPPVEWRDETFPGHDETIDRWLEQPDTVPDTPDGTDNWHQARTRALHTAKRRSARWRSVQEVAAKERVRHRASPVGAAGGGVVHDVLEQLDLSLPLNEVLEEVEPLVEAAAAEVTLEPELIPLCTDIVRRILQDPILDRARAAPERWVEVPFSVRDRGRMVSGRIDLAFPTNASRTHWVVVDWKSDLPAKDTPAWRNYERQLGWYAKALLKTVSPCEHVETVLVGPHPELGEPEPDQAALAFVMPELVDGLQRLLDAGAPIPAVGADIGEPVVATPELAWEEARVALCVGEPDEDVAALKRLGWKVVAVEPEGVTWASEAMDALAGLLGVQAEGGAGGSSDGPA